MQNKKVTYFISGFIYLLLSMTLSISAIADSNGVQVSGTATVSAVPDIAQFSFAVNGRGKSLPGLKLDIDKNSIVCI